MPGGVVDGVTQVTPLRRGLLRGINGHAAGVRATPVAEGVGLPASCPLLPTPRRPRLRFSCWRLPFPLRPLKAKGEEGTSMMGGAVGEDVVGEGASKERDFAEGLGS
jgi:hypothetical protein